MTEEKLYECFCINKQQIIHRFSSPNDVLIGDSIDIKSQRYKVMSIQESRSRHNTEMLNVSYDESADEKIKRIKRLIENTQAVEEMLAGMPDGEQVLDLCCHLRGWKAGNLNAVRRLAKECSGEEKP